MHVVTIYDAGGDDKLMFFFHGPNETFVIFVFIIVVSSINWVNMDIIEFPQLRHHTLAYHHGSQKAWLLKYRIPDVHACIMCLPTYFIRITNLFDFNYMLITVFITSQSSKYFVKMTTHHFYRWVVTWILYR